jgi:hypothetical protein
MLRSVCAKPTTCTVIRCEIAERFEISTGGIFDSMLTKFVGEIAARKSRRARNFGLGAVGHFQRALNHRQAMSFVVDTSIALA